MDNTSKKQFNYLNNYQPNTSSHNGNILLNNGFNNNNTNSYTASGFSSKTFYLYKIFFKKILSYK